MQCDDCVVVQVVSCHLGKNGQNSDDESKSAILPFVLIKGPPGTIT